MKKSTKILLGIATIWPVIYIPLFIVGVFLMTFLSPGNEGEAPALLALFPVIFLLHFLTIFGGIALEVFYIVNIFKNKRVEEDKRLMWVLLLFFLNLFVMPVYWYLYIWKEPQPALESFDQRASLNSSENTEWANRAYTEKKDYERVPPAPGNWRE